MQVVRCKSCGATGCKWFDASGSMHVMQLDASGSQCKWFNASGSMQVVQCKSCDATGCKWFNASGSMQVVQCKWFNASGFGGTISPAPNPGGRKICGSTPMDHDIETRLGNLRRAARCGAKTRDGDACQRPAMRGKKRCRLHGGLSPGAPRGSRNGNFKNGDWTSEAIAERKWLRSLVRSFAYNGTTE
jgi:uncharacterized protein YodC (DUF2158 family)